MRVKDEWSINWPWVSFNIYMRDIDSSTFDSGVELSSRKRGVCSVQSRYLNTHEIQESYTLLLHTVTIVLLLEIQCVKNWVKNWVKNSDSNSLGLGKGLRFCLYNKLMYEPHFKSLGQFNSCNVGQIPLLKASPSTCPFPCSVQFSHSVVSDSLQPHELQHARPPCPSPTPGVHSNSRLSSRWCHPAISSSVVSFSSCPQSLPASVFSNESTLRMRLP